jgi:hypothetical protein
MPKWESARNLAFFRKGLGKFSKIKNKTLNSNAMNIFYRKKIL